MNGTNLTLIFKHPVLISLELIWERLFDWYFRANLRKIIRLIPYSVFGIFNPQGLKLITRLWLGLSHLNEHRFKHNFNDCINPLCTCGLDIESTVHYFLHCNYYNSARISLLNGLNSVDRTLSSLSDLSTGRLSLSSFRGR